MSSFWKKWKKIVNRIVSVQANIFLTIIYFLVIIPVALVMQITLKKRIGANTGKRRTYWKKIPRQVYDLTWAQRQ